MQRQLPGLLRVYSGSCYPEGKHPGLARLVESLWSLLTGTGRGAWAAPSLLGCLPGDAEPRVDLGPGVSGAPQAADGQGDRVVNVVGQGNHVSQRVEISGGDAAAVGPEDAPGECGVLGVLGYRPRPLWCQASLTAFPAGHGRVCVELGWSAVAVMGSPEQRLLVASHRVGFRRQ